jgi:predicted TIM-barrel fold metal-dependent hydrolase
MQATTRAPDIAALRLFDTCLTLGRVVRSGTPESVTPDSVLGLMDKHDIAEALVHHNEARLRQPRAWGNRRLLREVAGEPRLHPVWVLDPLDDPGPRAARDLVDEMLASGARAARLMMGFAPPLHWVWRDLCEALEERRVPCFLDFAAPGYGPAAGSTVGNPDALTVDRLRDVALAHPDLPMILSHVSGGLGLAHPLFPLMRRAPNLHVDLTSVVDYARRAAFELGPERVFFATGAPYYDPATFVSVVQYEPGLTPEARLAIGGGNVRRLLEAAR